MSSRETAISDDALDALLDLEHDLGKHARLPLALLPADAEEGEVAEALATALLRTRRGPTGTRSARGIWEDFLAEARSEVSAMAAFADLETAVSRALAWEEAARLEGPVDRARAEVDLSAIAPAVRRVIEEATGGRQA